MAATTFIGRECVLTVTPTGGSAVVIGVAQSVDVEVTHDVDEVTALGDHKPQDIKEGVQHVNAKLKKALVANEFVTYITRDANGYLPEIAVEFKTVDRSVASPYPNKKYTLTGGKAVKWGAGVQSKSGIVLDNLEVKGKDLTYASSTQASFP